MAYSNHTLLDFEGWVPCCEAWLALKVFMCVDIMAFLCGYGGLFYFRQQLSGGERAMYEVGTHIGWMSRGLPQFQLWLLLASSWQKQVALWQREPQTQGQMLLQQYCKGSFALRSTLFFYFYLHFKRQLKHAKTIGKERLWLPQNQVV